MTQPERQSRRSDWWRLIAAAALCGWLFFTSLSRLWPLVPGDLNVPHARLHESASRFLLGEGIDVRAGYARASELTAPEDALGYVERAFGPERTRSLIRDGLPLTTYAAVYKRYGDASPVFVFLLPDGRPTGWRRDVQEDEPGGEIAQAAARQTAVAALGRVVGADMDAWKETGTSSRTLPRRVDHLFTFERLRSASPELRERAQVRVAGARAVSVAHTVIVPASADRENRRREAPRQALNAVGSLLFGLAVLGAFTVFVLRLRKDDVRIGRAATWSAAVFALSVAAALLRTSDAFLAWDPLKPRAGALLEFVVTLLQENVWTFAVLVAVVAAGDVLDRDLNAGRGGTLWKVTQGRLFDREVGASSARGFLLGLVCGGVMAASVLLLIRFAGASVALQPRGFFFFAINSPLPAISTLLYFLQVALLEELGYRYFAGAWLLRYTRRRWLAIFLPGLVYGLTHTSLTFLPPDQPFWARALVMTLVGCVWGWAFLRYDALTVVTSHLTADLFIFNWPRLASGDPWLVGTAILSVALPVAPALGLLGGLVNRKAETSLARQSPPPSSPG
jgi:hypothetical protein